MTRRVLIMGNSGSGKSTLARALATDHGLAHLDLDAVAWRHDAPTERRALEDASQQLDAFAREHRDWVIEGCYADLVELLLDRATELIFLDRSVATCQAHARARPFEPHKYPSKAAQDANLEMLLGFIADYPRREGPLGRAAHERLFEAFEGRRRRVTDASADRAAR